MPRANRHCLPGHVWHLTHRCHHQAFLLKCARDRHRYLHWLFEAKKRFGLSVLNYVMTSNHSGYREIQARPQRYAVIDLRGLSALCGFNAGQCGLLVEQCRER